MKCFNHHTVDALGICKNCNKGLCKDCLTEIKNGIACTTTCVDEVEQINSIVDKSKRSYSMASGAHMRNVYLLGAMGLVFILFGINHEGLTGFLSVIGFLFIIGAVLSYITAKKYKSNS